MLFQAIKPANLALIKYMGKTDEEKNIPCNASLSYTLDRFTSCVQLQPHNGLTHDWEPLEKPGYASLQLTHHGKQRFLAHLNWLNKQFNYSGHFIIRSANNFPDSCGLASSASSFAALTDCAIKALRTLQPSSTLTNLTTTAIAQLSQQGSGSSCRSFFSPWALWTPEELTPPPLKTNELRHYVVVLSAQAKTISSSEAHRRVINSPYFATRPQRAQQRLSAVINALNTNDWQTVCRLVWDDFQDMHHLFSTATPAFSYFNETTTKLLTYLQQQWQENGDTPMITMDAGPNIHLLFHPLQADSLEPKLLATLRQQFTVL